MHSPRDIASIDCLLVSPSPALCKIVPFGELVHVKRNRSQEPAITTNLLANGSHTYQVLVYVPTPPETVRVPIGVASCNTEPNGDSQVCPESLSKLSSDWCDGHCHLHDFLGIRAIVILTVGL